MILLTPGQRSRGAVRLHRLEQSLSHFSCLTKGDIIEIYHNMMTFEILIMELKPEDAPGVSIIDTDLSVSTTIRRA